MKVSRAEFLRVASLVTAGIGTSLLPQATLAKKDSDDQTSNEDKNLFQSVTGGIFQKKEVKRKSPAAVSNRTDQFAFTVEGVSISLRTRAQLPVFSNAYRKKPRPKLLPASILKQTLAMI